MQVDRDKPVEPREEHARLIILVDAPSLPFHAVHEGETEVATLGSFHEAIGEMATRLRSGRLSESDEPLIVAPAGRLADDAQEVTAALRRLHPRTRLVGVKTPGVEHDERLLTALGVDLLPAGDIEQALDLSSEPDTWPEPETRLEAEPPAEPSEPSNADQEPAAIDDATLPEPEIEETPTATELEPEATMNPGPDVEPPNEAAPATITGMADERLAALLVSDPEEVPDACVELLKQRLGLARLSLLSPEDTLAPDGERVQIQLENEDGSPLATLVVPADSEHLAYAWSAWLSSWLRATGHVLRLRSEATLDPLTGAWNRRGLMRYLEASLATAREKRQALTVMLFDVDDLKAYNDHYGHAAGDEVLRETVRLLRSVIRPGDRVCRLGGDEFVVVFYDPSGPRAPDSEHPRSAAELVRRFQRQVAHCRFPKLGEEAPGRLSVSGGLATFPWDGVDAESLIRCADERAMRAKQDGKNAIVLGPGAVAQDDRPN
jgi:diguanylate cyclase (GGDEF)-like protein